MQVIIQMVRHYIRGTLVKLIMSFHYNSQIQIYRNASSTWASADLTFRTRLRYLQGNAIRIDSKGVVSALIMGIAPLSLLAGQGNLLRRG